MVVGTLWQMNWKVLIADPTPFMLAHLTNHVGTATLLFNFDPTVFANADILIRSCPLLVIILYLLFTGFSIMRRMQTIKAIFFITCCTFNYGIWKIRWLLEITLTINSWASFNFRISINFLSICKFNIFRIYVVWHQMFLHKFYWDFFLACIKRTY